MYEPTSKGDKQLTQPSSVEEYEDPVVQAPMPPAAPSANNPPSAASANVPSPTPIAKIVCSNCKKCDCDCDRSKKWLWVFSLIIIVLVCIVLWLLYEDGSLSSLMASVRSMSSKSGKSKTPSKSR